MTALPADTVYVEIQANLNRLRQEMGQAERVVDDSTLRMDGITKKRGVFGLGQGLNYERFAGIAGVLRIAQAAAQGLAVGFKDFGDAQGEAVGLNEALIKTTMEFGNVMTFGLAGALNNLMDILDGTAAGLREIDAEMKRVNATTAAMTNLRGLQGQLAGVEATGPFEQAQAQLNESYRQIAMRLQANIHAGVPLPVAQETARTERRIAQGRAVESAFGDVPPAKWDEMLQYLKQIAANGSRGTR